MSNLSGGGRFKDEEIPGYPMCSVNLSWYIMGRNKPRFCESPILSCSCSFSFNRIKLVCCDRSLILWFDLSSHRANYNSSKRSETLKGSNNVTFVRVSSYLFFFLFNHKIVGYLLPFQMSPPSF